MSRSLVASVIVAVVLFVVASSIVEAGSLPLIRRIPSAPTKVFTPRPTLSHLLHKNAKSLGVDAPPPFSIPVNGNVWPVGGYYTKIYVGTPFQPQLVQIDTGSADLLIAQEGCVQCPNSTFYYPQHSRTVRRQYCNTTDFHCRSCTPQNYCAFNNTYQTCDYSDPTAACSLLGVTYYDSFSVQHGHLQLAAPNVGFGGITAHSGAHDDEWTNMPGVIGMAYPELASVWLRNTPFDALFSAGQLRSKLFGLCLGHDRGQMSWGEIDHSLYLNHTIYYTPVVTRLWYAIEITDMGVQGHTLGLPKPIYNKIGGGTIIDSGTNTFVVSEEIYDVIFARFVRLCKERNLVGVCGVKSNETLFSGKCFDMTEEEVDQFPTVGVKFKGVENVWLNVTGREYLWRHAEKGNRYCLEIQSSGVEGFTILGNVFQLPFYIVFDREKDRLGFAPKNPQQC